VNIEYTLRNVRFSYLHLDEPQASEAGGKPRYTANFILEASHPQLDELKGIVRKIEAAEFGGRVITGKDTCLRDGNTMVDKDNVVRDGYADTFYLSAARAEKRKAPRVVDRGKRDIQAGHADWPESGDYGSVIVNLYSLNGKSDKKANASYGKKVCCEIGTVKLLRKGEPLGGGGGYGNLDSLEDGVEDNDDL
jgi:hypothetical protein